MEILQMTPKQMRCGTETKLFTRRRFLMKDMRLWGAIFGLVIASWLLYPSVFAKRPPAVENDDVIVIHYVCRESGKVFELPLAGECCEHPETGRQTLVPAVYDARRKKWRPGPPLAEMRQMGLLSSVPRD